MLKRTIGYLALGTSCLAGNVVGCGSPSSANPTPTTNATVSVDVYTSAGVRAGTCLGTLISSDTVLTAGHCTAGYAAWQISAATGQAVHSTVAYTYDWIDFQSNLSHPDHDDIAVIKLGTQITLPQYPQVTSSALASGSAAMRIRPASAGGIEAIGTMAYDGSTVGFPHYYYTSFNAGSEALVTGGALIDPISNTIYGVASGLGSTTGNLYVSRVELVSSWLQAMATCSGGSTAGSSDAIITGLVSVECHPTPPPCDGGMSDDGGSAGSSSGSSSGGSSGGLSSGSGSGGGGLSSGGGSSSGGSSSGGGTSGGASSGSSSGGASSGGNGTTSSSGGGASGGGGDDGGTCGGNGGYCQGSGCPSGGGNGTSGSSSGGSSSGGTSGGASSGGTSSGGSSSGGASSGGNGSTGGNSSGGSGTSSGGSGTSSGGSSSGGASSGGNGTTSSGGGGTAGGGNGGYNGSGNGATGGGNGTSGSGTSSGGNGTTSGGNGADGPGCDDSSCGGCGDDPTCSDNTEDFGGVPGATSGSANGPLQ